MKYIAYRECNPEDLDKITAKNNKINEERKKFPDRYPKILLQDGTPLVFNISGSIGRGFNLLEATEEQIINLTSHWIPEMKWNFVPIFESSKIGEAIGKLNK